MLADEEPQEIMPQAGSLDDVPLPPDPPRIHAAPVQVDAPAEERASCITSVWRFLVGLFKLALFVAVIAGLIAVAVYFWPQAYSRYILPVENNIAKVAVLEAHQQDEQAQLNALQTQLPAMAASVVQQAAALTAQAPRVDALEGTLGQQNAAQAKQAAEQAAALAALAPRLATLDSVSASHAQALAALQATQAGLLASDTDGKAELERQVTVLKSIELLSRARLFLYESNFGLAKQDMQAGRDLLAGLSPDPGLAEVVERLDLALSRLPDYPVAASDDLDIAWQILLGGPAQPLTALTAPAASAGTPTPTPSPTPTP